MLHSEGVVWLTGAVVCLLPALWVQLVINAGSGWLCNILWCDQLMPITCQVRDCKALLVIGMTHISSTV